MADTEVARIAAEELKANVSEAFSNAFENGFDFTGWTPRAIAEDMCSYDSDIENYEVEDVERAVRQHIEEQGYPR